MNDDTMVPPPQELSFGKHVPDHVTSECGTSVDWEQSLFAVTVGTGPNERAHDSQAALLTLFLGWFYRNCTYHVLISHVSEKILIIISIFRSK